MASLPALRSNLLPLAIYVPWLLWVVAFILLLSGTASVQQACGQGLNTTSLIGTSGFFAPVSCDKFFEYTWWITIYTLFAVVATGVILILQLLQKVRVGVVGLAVIDVILLSDVANSFIFINQSPFANRNFKARERVVVAGAVLGSIASLLIITLAGLNDERAAFHPGSAVQKAPTGEPQPVPTSRAEVTYTADAEEPPSI